uniref:Synaptosomal-associated protein n=1 Tax=Petromyzon marinus TaxID=7757 RepID=A0AAJ7T6I5_PETMA|nr:synaptosomal-associated protein 23-like [Petromyzon marinus]
MDEDSYNVQIKANQLTDESLEATRRMRNMVVETQATGANTLVMLNEQGEQLNTIEQNLDHINEDMKEADKYIRQMSKCCGLCICPCNKMKSIDNKGAYKPAVWGSISKEKVVSEQPGKAGQQGQPQASGPFIKRITDDDREDEMEENLQEIGDIIGNLKGMALNMGNELDQQNTQLERLNEKAELNTSRINQSNQNATKLLK